MCVAAVIFSPISMQYLQCMEEDNPHGAGVAWLQGDSIRFMRGLSAQDIYQMQEDKVMTYPYLMHYRWATHGDKIPQLTHPFPIGPRALLGELHGNAPAVLIHNGTWNSYDKAAGRHIRAGNYEIPEEIFDAASDTAVAAFLAQDNPEILDEIMWATAVAEIREEDGVKTMEITTRGQWYDKEGNWYSNLNWVPWSGYYFPSMYSSTSDSAADRANYWKEWERRYRAGEDTSGLRYPGSYDPSEDAQPKNDWDEIDWDAYFLAPFSTRGEKDQHLNFDTYVERFRRSNKAAATVAAGTSTDKEFSWDDYLTSKYGAKVGAIVKESYFPDEGDNGGVSPGVPDACCITSPDGEHEFFDADAVSEDWETVNAILERQMRNKWGA